MELILSRSGHTKVVITLQTNVNVMFVPIVNSMDPGPDARAAEHAVAVSVVRVAVIGEPGATAGHVTRPELLDRLRLVSY